MSVLGIPSGQQLTDLGVNLEDHGAAQAEALITKAAAQLQDVGNELIDKATRSLETMVDSDILPAIKLVIADTETALHAILDRLNASKVVLEDGGAVLVIPARKDAGAV